MKNKFFCGAMLIPSASFAQLDRAGNVIESGGGAFPKWALVLAGAGLIVYGVRNINAPDGKFSIGLGAIILIGCAI